MVKNLTLYLAWPYITIYTKILIILFSFRYFVPICIYSASIDYLILLISKQKTGQFAHGISFVFIQVIAIIKFVVKCDETDFKGEEF